MEEKSKKRTLFTGGLVGVGFDKSGSYLLTVSHFGRAVFSTTTCEKVARDYLLAYPVNGLAFGIGPLEGQIVPVAELHSDTEISITSPDNSILLKCRSDAIELTHTCPETS